MIEDPAPLSQDQPVRIGERRKKPLAALLHHITQGRGVIHSLSGRACVGRPPFHMYPKSLSLSSTTAWSARSRLIVSLRINSSNKKATNSSRLRNEPANFCSAAPHRPAGSRISRHSFMVAPFVSLSESLRVRES